MPEYQTFIGCDLRYHYDDWSNTGLSSLLRHRIIFHVFGDEEGDMVDLEAMAFDSWIQGMKEWCSNNIGMIGESWHCTRSQSTFYFKDIESAAAFKLCWG